MQAHACASVHVEAAEGEVEVHGSRTGPWQPDRRKGGVGPAAAALSKITICHFCNHGTPWMTSPFPWRTSYSPTPSDYIRLYQTLYGL